MALKIPEVIKHDEFLKIVNDEKVKKKTKNCVAYLLGFYQCLRISEVVKLEKSDYDASTKLLKIRQAKGSKDRIIPIAPECVKVIKYLPVSSKHSKDNGIRALQYAFKKDVKRILGKNLHFHTLRHGGASYYLNVKKWDIRQVQRFLGHSDIKITQIYTHVDPSDLTKLMWDNK